MASEAVWYAMLLVPVAPWVSMRVDQQAVCNNTLYYYAYYDLLSIDAGEKRYPTKVQESSGILAIASTSSEIR